MLRTLFVDTDVDAKDRIFYGIYENAGVCPRKQMACDIGRATFSPKSEGLATKVILLYNTLQKARRTIQPDPTQIIHYVPSITAFGHSTTCDQSAFSLL